MSYANPKFHSVSAPPPLEDLLPNMAPKHHITIVSGDSYVGKTRMACQMAEALSLGKPFFWPALPPLKTMYFCERSASSVVRHVRDLELDLSQVTFVTLLDLTDVDITRYVDDFIKWLKLILAEHKPDIIFLDTLAHFLPSYARARGSMNDYTVMTRAIIEIQRLCMKCNVTPICLYHNAKERIGAEFKNYRQRVSGSAAIGANTLALWSMSEMEGPIDPIEKEPVPYRKLEISYHHAADQVIYFRTLPNGSFSCTSLAAIDAPIETKSKPDKALDLLKGAQWPRKVCLERLSSSLEVGRTRAQNILKNLIDSNKITQFDLNGEPWISVNPSQNLHIATKP